MAGCVGSCAADTRVLIFQQQLRYQHYTTAYGEVKTVTLLDGTQVTLNANSELKVPRFMFGWGTREVLLAGEAKFAVKHTPDHRRFVVRTPDQLEIQVLGTEFIVYSRTKGSKVVLKNGKVQIRSLKNRSITPFIIRPGDVVQVSQQGKVALQHHQPLIPHTAWTEHRFVFENTSVTEIANRLTEQFGVQITIADSTLANRTLGGTFKAQSVDELLLVLGNLLDIDVQHKAGQPASYELKPAH